MLVQKDLRLLTQEGSEWSVRVNIFNMFFDWLVLAIDYCTIVG